MSKADRIRSYLIRRLERAALRATLAQACSAGLLSQEQVSVQGLTLLRYKEGPMAGLLPTRPDRNRNLIQKLLSRPLELSNTSANKSGDLTDEVVQELLKEGIEVELGDLDGGTGRPTSGKMPVPSAGSADYSPAPQQLLDALRHAGSQLPAVEVAVCLLLAYAVRAASVSAEQILSALASPAPIFCVRASIHDFETVLASMLQLGTLLPRTLRLHDGVGAYSRDFPEQGDGRPRSFTVITLKMSHLESVGPERARQALAKARRYAAPVLITTEVGMRLPSRITGGADVVINTPMLDVRLLAEIIAICCGFPLEHVIAGIQSRSIPIPHLGLDDLSLAIRAGRPLADILTRLQVLASENRKLEGGEDQDEEPKVSETPKKKDPAKSRDSTSSSTRSQSAQRTRADKSGKHDINIIEPEAKGKRRGGHKRPALLVETLSGYGEAREWVLNLQDDLRHWKRKRLAWSEMSTKLLLSGPPGTGKTTFARAMCNTLQIPLLATSVASWLEPGYLGDVLKRISATFDAAHQHGPAILFIDEIDGVGQRDGGGSRHYDDYWVTVVNRVLELLDGTIRSEGIIIVGATNRPEAIDPALRRSGRLETHIAIQPPDLDALEGILAFHLGNELKHVLATSHGKPMQFAATQGEFP